jgi:hypothetical protein
MWRPTTQGAVCSIVRVSFVRAVFDLRPALGVVYVQCTSTQLARNGPYR